MREIAGLQSHVLDLLPADDESHGLRQTSPASLRVSSSLLEQYRPLPGVSEQSRRRPDAEVVRLTFRVPPDDSQQDEVDGWASAPAVASASGTTSRKDAEYELAVGLLRTFTATSPDGVRPPR